MPSAISREKMMRAIRGNAKISETMIKYLSCHQNNEKIKNLAFIDGQNLYMAQPSERSIHGKIDLARFRVYLKENIASIRHTTSWIRTGNKSGIV